METNEAESHVDKNMNVLEGVDLSKIEVKAEIDPSEAESNMYNGQLQEKSEEKFYQCGACKETFTKYLDLKVHVKKFRKNKKNRTHSHGLTSFNCVKCKKTFSYAFKLNDHVTTHTESHVDNNMNVQAAVGLFGIEVKAEIDPSEAESTFQVFKLPIWTKI